MRIPFLLTSLFLLVAVDAGAQLRVEASYGVVRNVESPDAELDGWLNATVEWVSPSGLALGVGSDHHFEGASIEPVNHRSSAVYVVASIDRRSGRIAPFVRGGIGLGPAPCVSDTCGGGLYVRGSAGLRARIGGYIELTTEVGVTRVSRPIGGAGLALRF